MKKKGFTLVELLAVIAILAILIIIAIPNILELFNNAKKDTFVTEIRRIMDSAEKQFVMGNLNSGGSVYYSSTENSTLNTQPLNMETNGKEYFIKKDNLQSIKNYLESEKDIKIVFDYKALYVALKKHGITPNKLEETIENAENIN